MRPPATSPAESAESSFTSFEAALPEPYRILGLRLLPLSLGRYRLLARFNVAFVSDESTSPTAADLILGVLICSMPCAEFEAWLHTENMWREIRHWSKKIYPAPWLGVFPVIGKWWRSRHGFDLLEKMRLFASYITEGQRMPKFWIEEMSSQVTGAHWSQSMEVILRSELHWSELEIDEKPLTKAIADYFTYFEQKGSIRLMTPEDEARPDVLAGLTPEQLAELDRLAKEANLQAN